jgi:hypothetical protein
MNDLASEFFYDGIARIPAGLVVIVLYWRREAENVFHTHSQFFSSPILFIACILAIAWIVGFMVDMTVYATIAFSLRWLSQYCKLASELRLLLLDEKPNSNHHKSTPIIRRILFSEDCQPKNNQPSQVEESKEYGGNKSRDKKWEREKRRQGYFRIAETIMCRCLWVVFLCAWILHFAQFHPPEPFSNLDGYYYFVGFCAFLVVWIWLLSLKQNQERPTEEGTHQP